MLDIICFSMLVLMIAYNIQSSRDPVAVANSHRYGSFAPVRESGKAVWYVDGKDYMSAVADAIEAAETEILITDWQMSPEIFMKRPDSGVDSLYWRLDEMLLRKADEAGRVCILLYWEVKRALDLGSDHVVKLLAEHKNIEVHRHPDTFTGAANLFRWSHHEKMVIVDHSIVFVGGIDLCYGRWDTRNHELMDNFRTHFAVDEGQTPIGGDTLSNHARWIGKDYRNTFYNKEKRTDWEKPLEGYDGVERNEIPRMPWHDVSCAFSGEAVQDAVKHFTDRYNAVTKPWWHTYFNWFLQYFPNANRLKQLFYSEKVKAKEAALNTSGHNVNIQFLRSASSWSTGQPDVEHSIYHAYLEAIKNARHFIYIENQFFISSQEGFWRSVQNKIQSALVERIVRAHRNEKFHVMVFTPLKPEFAGDWDGGDWNADGLRAVTYWNQASIYHGDDSLFKKLEKENISKDTAMNYFSVFSLRTFDLIEEYFVTEIVYVHSKIMIVDDRLAIIGSANINDRSMLGERDSEVAVMIEDVDFIDGEMDGVKYKMGKFAHSLRCDLLEEHLGQLGNHDNEFDIAIKDPLADSFIVGVYARADLNTILYLTVFGPGLLPNENVQDFEALKRYKDIPLPHKNTENVRDVLEQIKGNIVNYPCTFLIKELKESVLDYGLHMYVNNQVQQSPTTLFV